MFDCKVLKPNRLLLFVFGFKFKFNALLGCCKFDNKLGLLFNDTGVFEKKLLLKTWFVLYNGCVCCGKIVWIGGYIIPVNKFIFPSWLFLFIELTTCFWGSPKNISSSKMFVYFFSWVEFTFWIWTGTFWSSI